MAHHKSAKKRIRRNEKRRLRNKAVRSRMKTEIKKLLSAVAEKNAEKAEQLLPQVISVIDSAKSKGVIHKNNASRRVSRLTRLVNSTAASR